MRRSGFSLIELSLSATLLSLALLACFQLFEWSSRAFILAHLRSGLEGEARRVLASLHNDLRQGDFTCLSIINSNVDPARRVASPEGSMVERDGYGLACLTRWDDPALLDAANARPRWNRYTIVYATLTNPGRLVKQYCRPGTPPFDGPVPALAGRMNENPATNPQASPPTILSENVNEFEVLGDEVTQTLTYRLTLAARGTRKAEGKLINERCQVSFSTRLQNTGAF